MKTRLIALCCILYGTTLWGQFLELDNGTLHLKQDLIRGGTISHISESGSDRNLVNIHDEGRYIQQSYFAGIAIDRQADGQHPNWSPWPWNPIQAGDSYWNRAEILEQSSDGDTLYVKCIPMLWDMNNDPAEAVFEQWSTLMGNVVKVRNKVTCMRTDELWVEGISRDQELPAVYPIASLNKLYSYFGPFPFTGAPLTNLEVVHLSSGFWGRYPDMVVENWMAFVDESGWGMAIYTPICDDFIAGRSGSQPKGEAMDNPTSYISPVKKMIVNKNTVIDYEYYLVIGTLDQIRREIYALKGIQTNRWEFKEDLEGWNLDPRGGSVSHGEGVLKFTANGSLPSVGKQVANWSPDTLNYLWVKLKNETAGDTAVFRAFNADGDSLDIPFGIAPLATEFKDYVVQLDTLEGWKSSGDFSRFKFIPTEEGVTGDVSVDYIRFTENLMELSSYGNYREIIGLGSTLQLFARAVPSLNDLDVSWSVDDPALASVDENGLLTALVEGIVRVTATDKQEASLTASLLIELIDDEQKGSWEFDRNLGGWTVEPHNAEVAHEEDVLKYTVLGNDPYVSNQVAPWPVNDLKYLWMKVKNETAGNGGSIYFFPEEGDFGFVDFPLVPNDTEFRDVFVDMSKSEKWNSNQVMNSLRLDANRNGEPGDIYFDFIRFMDNLVAVTAEDGASEIIGLGNTLQLYANLIVPGETSGFNWVVNDSSIATIDANGLLTAVANGMVMVKASSKDNPDVSGSLAIAVIDPDLPKTIEVSSEGEQTGIVGIGNSLQLYAKDPVSGNAAEVDWSVDNYRSASIDTSGLLSSVKEGVVNVKAALKADPDVYGTIKITISDISDNINSIETKGMNIFPNPAGDRIYVQNIVQAGDVSILNLSGEVLGHVSINAADASISIETLVPGMYILRIEHENQGSSYHRFVKK